MSTVRFFKRGRGDVRSAVRYVLKSEGRLAEPELMAGDPNLLIDVCDGISRQWKYTSGSVNIFEKLTPEQETEMIESFEAHHFAGLDKNQYSIIWVKHQDHDHSEYHFITAREELTTGNELNISPPNKYEYSNLWRDWFDSKHNFISPTFAVNEFSKEKEDYPEAVERNNIKQQIHDNVRDYVVADLVKSRADLISQTCKDFENLTFVKTTKTSVTFKDENNQKIRLKGGLWDERKFAETIEIIQNDVKEDRRLNETPEQTQARFEKMSEYQNAKAASNQKRYPTEEKGHEAKLANDYAEAQFTKKEIYKAVSEAVERTKEQKRFYSVFKSNIEAETANGFEFWEKGNRQYLFTQERDIKLYADKDNIRGVFKDEGMERGVAMMIQAGIAKGWDIESMVFSGNDKFKEEAEKQRQAIIEKNANEKNGFDSIRENLPEPIQPQPVEPADGKSDFDKINEAMKKANEEKAREALEQTAGAESEDIDTLAPLGERDLPERKIKGWKYQFNGKGLEDVIGKEIDRSLLLTDTEVTEFLNCYDPYKGMAIDKARALYEKFENLSQNRYEDRAKEIAEERYTDCQNLGDKDLSEKYGKPADEVRHDDRKHWLIPDDEKSANREKRDEKIQELDKKLDIIEKQRIEAEKAKGTQLGD